MNKQSIREIFDNISLSVISFLENHIGITDVEFTERQGKAFIRVLTLLQAWLRRRYPSGRRRTGRTYCQTTTRHSFRFQTGSVSTGRSRRTTRYSPLAPCTSTSSGTSSASRLTGSSSRRSVKRRKHLMKRALPSKSKNNSK